MIHFLYFSKENKILIVLIIATQPTALFKIINKDGSKRFASTNGKVINLNPVKTIDEFFDYKYGKLEYKKTDYKLSIVEKNKTVCHTILVTISYLSTF